MPGPQAGEEKACGDRHCRGAQAERELRKHSKNKTPVTDISKALKRTVGALRQKARHLGISIGHRQRTKKSRRRA